MSALAQLAASVDATLREYALSDPPAGQWERRIDGYPMAREPTSWLEVGFKLGTR